jgi:hypothetical protein
VGTRNSAAPERHSSDIYDNTIDYHTTRISSHHHKMAASLAQEKKVHNVSYHAGLARDALQQLRYDYRYSLSSLQAVVKDGEDQTIVRLDSWDPSKVQTIERVWDNVPLWDPKIGLERLSDFDAIDTYFGVAILVADDDALVAATGMEKTDSGEAIRKAKFERPDESGGVLQGIVCPSRRWRGPGDHGLKLNQGPGSALNRRLIARH